MKAVYSQHGGGNTRSWGDVIKVKDAQGADTTHPVVYVAKGSHASYFTPDDETEPGDSLPGESLDEIEYDEYRLELLQYNNQRWLEWKGRWGWVFDLTFGWTGSPGPIYRAGSHGAPFIITDHTFTWGERYIWFDPIAWAKELAKA